MSVEKNSGGSSVIRMPVAGLTTNLFVRKALDQDRVFALAELIEGGTGLPPIKATAKGEVIDGRHRKEAYELLSIELVDVEILSITDERQLIAEAYRSNTGGSLPPSTEDTEHTIGLLLSRGVAKKNVAEMLGLPLSVARRYMDTVQSKIARASLMKALAGVADDGLTIVAAAEKYDVDLEKLKDALSGRRRKYKKGVAEVKTGITYNFRSLASKTSALMRSLSDKFDEGDVTPQQMEDIFDHFKQLQHRAASSIADWEKRFAAKSGGGDAGETVKS